VQLIEPTCDLDNGIYQFRIGGGTGPFEVLLDGQAVEVYEQGQISPITTIDNTFVGKLLEIRNLAGGTFQVTVIDDNSCEADDEFTLVPNVLPIFETESAEICELDPLTRNAVIATVRAVEVELSNAVPIYNWYYLDAANNEVLINDGATVFGATASINGASELSLQGLAASVNPYTVYLKVTGDFVCNNSLIPAEILVSPLPDPVFEAVDASCFDGNDGRIELVSGGSPDYEYELSDPTVTFDVTDQAFIDLSAGSYTVTVTNTATGCFDTFDFEIQEPDALVLSEDRGIDATCGEENGEIFFRVDGGTGPYSIFVNNLPIEVYQFFLGATGVYNVRGLGPGSYSVRVEDDNGCSEEELNWITLQNNEGETVTAIPAEVTVCEGTPATLKPTVTVSGGVTPVLTWYLDSELTLAISAGVNPGGIEFILLPDGSLEVRGLPVGDYEYFVGISGQNVCTNSTSGTIEVLEPVSADVVATDIICFGDENGSIQVSNVSGGNSDFEFSLNETIWQDAPLFENLAPGTYTVYVRDKTLLSNCAWELPGVEVKSPTGPIISNTPQIFAESCESANGEIFGLVISGGWGNYTYEWRKDNPTNGAVITGTITGIEDAEAGTYYLLIEDEKGCSEVFEYVIGTAPDPQYILLAPIDVCEGNPVTLAPLHVAINPNTPTARTDVSWFKGPNQTGLIQDGVDSANPAVSYSIDDSDWLNPKLIVTGLAPGTYTYYFFVECTGVEMPISVTVYPTPAVVIEVSRETCAGENDGKISVISGHQAGYIYRIGTVNLTLAQLESRNFAGGSYTIEVITPEGCNQLLSAEIEATTPLKLDLLDSKDAACGLTDGFIEVELTGGWAPYTVELTEVNSSIKTTLTGTDNIYKFENLSQGTYTVTVTDAEQCSITLSNQVTVEDGPSEVLLDDAYFICEGEVLELRPGVNPANANAQFNWYLNSVSVANKLSDGQTVNGAQLSINANGTIFRAAGLTPSNDLRLVVTVEGPGICVGDEQEVLVQVLSLPVVTFSKVDEICFGDLGQIILDPSVNSGALQYSVNGGTFQTYPNNIIGNLAQGSYQIQVRNLANCIVDLPAITIEGPIAALQVRDYGNIGASCEADNGVIFGEVSGGEAPYLIQIRRAGQLLQNQVTWDDTKFQISDLALGTYDVILADSRGCEVTLASTSITDEPTPIEVNSVIICEGETAVLTPFIPGVPSSPGYLWYKDAAKTRQIPLGSSQENGVGYELGANGVLRVNSLPANGSPYRYFVELNLAATCDTKVAEANVVVNPLPNLRTFNPSIVCDPTETVNLTNFIDNFNANIYDYEVTAPSGAALRLDQISTVSQTGTYLVRTKFKNSSCWTGQERILVRIAGEEIIANFDYQLDLGSGNFLTNSDIGIEELVQFIDISEGNAVAWEWDFGDGTTSTLQNPVHEYKEKGTYIIRLTTYSNIGCISVIERTVNVFDDYLIMFPNAFTPVRTDGKNNIFYPKYRGIASLKLYIFNTWGELIYMSQTLEQGGWDGTLNSQSVPNGNYVYKAEYTTRGGLNGSKAGVFILVK
jgi:large repetitive protein